MILRAFASICLLILFGGLSAAQSAEPRLAFQIADVHASPHRMFPLEDPGTLRGNIYTVRQSTLINLIARAYASETADVQGGPTWLEMNRYDIIAETAPGTSPEALKQMMQSLLADRFKLVVHRGEQATAAYALSVGKDKPKLTESAADEKSHCDLTNLPPNADGIANEKLACRHITMGGAGKCTAGRFRELSAQLSSGFHRIEGRL